MSKSNSAPQAHPLFQQKARVFERYHAPVNYRDPWQIFRIMSEFVAGYQMLGELKKTATIFGSARAAEDSFAYREARKCGYLLGREGYSVITGGGPGVMEAGNRGAKEAKAESVGLSIQLPEEQITNPYLTKNTGFNYFFIRKMMLVSPADATIFFPGGLGTLDEFFELIDLIELNKIKRIPVIVVGKEFWNPILFFLRKCSLSACGAIKESDLKIFQMVDTAEEAVAIVKNSKIRKNLCNPSEENCGQSINWRVFRIMAEVVEGFEFLTKEIHNDITILGTKSVTAENEFYQSARQIAYCLGKKGYMIVTGGGSGIMEAANRGASEAGVPSIGFSLRFEENNRLNQYVSKSLSFNFPYIRKLILTIPSKAFVFFPGGFGTLHQLFEVLTLMKTKKMQEMVVLLYGRDFWTPLDEVIKEILLKKYKSIAPEYVNLYKIIDSPQEAEKFIPDLAS